MRPIAIFFGAALLGLAAPGLATSCPEASTTYSLRATEVSEDGVALALPTLSFTFALLDGYAEGSLFDPSSGEARYLGLGEQP